MLKQAGSFLEHLIRAKSPSRMHSPFLFQLLTEIHNEGVQPGHFDAIESQRASLRANTQTVATTDHGAGSRTRSGKQGRRIRTLARTSLSSPAKCRLISRLIARQKPPVMLELGTSLGIMSAYLASGNLTGTLHTIESNPDILEVARKTTGNIRFDNIEFHQGTFEQILPSLLPRLQAVDFLLIDGDHRGKALLRYYHQIKPFLSEDAIVMIDDIRWSADMYEGWNKILRDPQVTCSLDYFSFGLLFFRSEFKENLRLKIKGRLIY